MSGGEGGGGEDGGSEGGGVGGSAGDGGVASSEGGEVRAAVARAAATGVSGRGNLAEAAPDNDRYITDNRRSRKLFVAQLIINQLF